MEVSSEACFSRSISCFFGTKEDGVRIWGKALNQQTSDKSAQNGTGNGRGRKRHFRHVVKVTGRSEAPWILSDTRYKRQDDGDVKEELI